MLQFTPAFNFTDNVAFGILNVLAASDCFPPFLQYSTARSKSFCVYWYRFFIIFSLLEFSGPSIVKFHFVLFTSKQCCQLNKKMAPNYLLKRDNSHIKLFSFISHFLYAILSVLPAIFVIIMLFIYYIENKAIKSFF